MTERLYYSDAYLTSFDAKVESVDGVRVRLSRTAFYPTSGGQQFDTGTLGGLRVADVLDEDAGIIHLLEAAPQFRAGDIVRGQVDWARRFDHMQQHTGQHLLSAIFEDLLGARTTSVHFGVESATLDVDAEAVSRNDAIRVESRVNQVAAENRPVIVAFEDAATAAGLRKASDRSGQIRIVSIDGIDRSACGGTHVRTTGEIGAVLVRRLEKYKKLTRVEFLCGARAVARARVDYDALSGMALNLSAGIGDLPALVTSQTEALRALESERNKLGEALAGYRARELYDATPAGSDGVRRVVHRAGRVDELRVLASAVCALPKAAFIGTCDSPATIVLATSEDSGIDSGAALKAALAAHGGRGGGNPRVAQGTAPTAEAVRAITAALAK
jgi:alanyl-tRNA synthetase